jgi:hypothetical protein
MNEKCINQSSEFAEPLLNIQSLHDIIKSRKFDNNVDYTDSHWY